MLTLLSRYYQSLSQLLTGSRLPKSLWKYEEDRRSTVCKGPIGSTNQTPTNGSFTLLTNENESSYIYTFPLSLNIWYNK